MKVIAIIGFGFCGRLAFFHLTKKPTKNKILIFDKNGQDALGSAFSRFSPHYILNVPANKMSAFEENAHDFCEFLARKYPKIIEEVGESGFVSRQIYGEYLKEITQNSFNNAKENGIEFEFIEDEVVKIKNEFSIVTKKDKSYQSNEILLATSLKQSVFSYSEGGSETKSIWDRSAFDFHQNNSDSKKICLVGSGLSAVDAIIGLSKKNFAGEILVISRRGNFPKEHFSVIRKCPNFIVPEDAKKGLLFLCLKIRQFLLTNPDFDLRHVVESIRPITQKLWHNFDEKNKKLFLRFLPYWNIFRHRAPKESLKIIQKMIASNQLRIMKGNAKALLTKTNPDHVINCLGFELCVEKYPLFLQMMNDGFLKKDLIFVQSSHSKIHLLGALNIGKDFECTSVPDMHSMVAEVIKKI